VTLSKPVTLVVAPSILPCVGLLVCDHDDHSLSNFKLTMHHHPQPLVYDFSSQLSGRLYAKTLVLTGPLEVTIERVSKGDDESMEVTLFTKVKTCLVNIKQPI
jgi:uncharacterized protein (DUF2249 family)